MLWSAGVVASPAGQWLGADFFGFRKDPQLLPGVAHPAIQEGKYVARFISRRVRGQSPPAPFWFWDKGNLAIVGRTFAVADLQFVRFSGATRGYCGLGFTSTF